MAPAVATADVVRGGDSSRSGGSSATDRDGLSSSSQSLEQLDSPGGGGGATGSGGSTATPRGGGRRQVSQPLAGGQPAAVAAAVPVPVLVPVAVAAEPPAPWRLADAAMAPTAAAPGPALGAAAAAVAAATVTDAAASDDDTSSWETCSDSDEERVASSKSRASRVPPVTATSPEPAAAPVAAQTVVASPTETRPAAAAVAHNSPNGTGGSSPAAPARPSKAKSARPAATAATAPTADGLAKAQSCSPGMPAKAKSIGRAAAAPPASMMAGTAATVVAATTTGVVPAAVKTKSGRHDGAPPLSPPPAAVKTTSGAARTSVPALTVGAGDAPSNGAPPGGLDTLDSASQSMAIEPAAPEAADFATSARSRVSGSNISLGPLSMGFDRSAASERPSARLSGRSGRLPPFVNVPAGVGGGEDGGGGGGAAGGAGPAAAPVAGGPTGSSAPIGRSRNPVGRMLSFTKDKGAAGGGKPAKAADSKADGGRAADAPPQRSSHPMGRLVSFNRNKDGKRGSHDEERDGAPLGGGGGKASGHGGGIMGLARSISTRRDKKESSRRKQREKEKEEATAAAVAATGLDALGVTSPVTSRASDGARSALTSPTDVIPGARTSRGGQKEFEADVDDELDAAPPDVAPPSRRASERASREGLASRPSGRLLSFRGGRKEAKGGKEDGGAPAKEEKDKKSKSRAAVSGLVKSVSRRKDKTGEAKTGGSPGVKSPSASASASCRSPTSDGLSWAELDTSEVKKAAHLDVAVRAPVLIPAPYSGPASKSNWHVNFLTMPHNALRREMSDLYELLLAMVDFGPALRKADFRDLRTWWHVFARFLRDWLDIERRLLFPWVHATGAHNWELQSTLRELRATKDFLDMKLEELAIYLDGFESLPPTEMFSLLYKCVDALAPRLMGYFGTQERVFPAGIRATYVADDAVRLEKEMVDALLNGAPAAPGGAAGASKATSGGSGADSLCALSRGVTDAKHLKVWVQRNLSATARLSYGKWVKHFNEAHRGVVRSFKERTPKAGA